MKNFGVIVAATSNGGIGKSGTLPWRLPSDMNYFKLLTIGTSAVNGNSNNKRLNGVIMGRKTWGNNLLIIK